MEQIFHTFADTLCDAFLAALAAACAVGLLRAALLRRLSSQWHAT